MIKVTNTLLFTQEQLRAKLLRDDNCAINALFKLLDVGTGIEDGDRKFLTSLRDQVIWRRREHERGLNLNKPVLTSKQLSCLRRSLAELYLDDLYEIATQRLAGVAPFPDVPPLDEPEEMLDWEGGEPVSQSWFCTVCDGLAVIEHCGLRYCRGCYEQKQDAEAQPDPYDLRHLHCEG